VQNGSTVFNKKSQSNLGRAALPPLMAENNYSTKSPLVTMGCPTFTPKTALPFRRWPQLIHPSLDRHHLPPQTTSRSNQPLCPSIPSEPTDRPTDRQTDRPTNGIDDKSVPTAAYT